MAAEAEQNVAKTAASTGSQTTLALVGLDWGTNASCLLSAAPDKAAPLSKEIIPTVVGYAKEGLLDGILPDNRTTLFGNEALKHRLHLLMHRPMKCGVVADDKAAADFAVHMRSRLPVNGAEIRAVVGVPASADAKARDAVRNAVRGVFDKLILIPEPFLAALGFRSEDKVGTEGYIDPVNNSLFIDIGAGSTDLCLVQGYYPQADDQISYTVAGDAVDNSLAHLIAQKYPDSDLTMDRVREIKEEHSYVGKPSGEIVVERMIGGKKRKLDLTLEVGQACQQILDTIFDGVKRQIARANPDSVPELLQNIVITGGGCKIANLGPELQKLLDQDGYDAPRVRVLGDDYKEFVARGALKAARAAKERQWQTLIG